MYNEKKIAVLSFDNLPRYGYRGMRIMRADLLSSLLITLEKVGRDVRFGKKLSAINDGNGSDDMVEARFADGTVERASLILGCDGIHSITRTAYIQPSRKPVYTGLAAAYGVLPTADINRQSISKIPP